MLSVFFLLGPLPRSGFKHSLVFPVDFVTVYYVSFGESLVVRYFLKKSGFQIKCGITTKIANTIYRNETTYLTFHYS